MNDAPAHWRNLSRDGELCDFVAAYPAACRVWWVTTHQRRNIVQHPGHPPISHDIIRNFNVGMREWFEAGHCGLSHVVDVFNMTGAAIARLFLLPEGFLLRAFGCCHQHSGSW